MTGKSRFVEDRRPTSLRHLHPTTQSSRCDKRYAKPNPAARSPFRSVHHATAATSVLGRRRSASRTASTAFARHAAFAAISCGTTLTAVASFATFARVTSCAAIACRPAIAAAARARGRTERCTRAGHTGSVGAGRSIGFRRRCHAFARCGITRAIELAFVLGRAINSRTGRALAAFARIHGRARIAVAAQNTVGFQQIGGARRRGAIAGFGFVARIHGGATNSSLRKESIHRARYRIAAACFVDVARSNRGAAYRSGHEKPIHRAIRAHSGARLGHVTRACGCSTRCARWGKCIGGTSSAHSRARFSRVAKSGGGSTPRAGRGECIGGTSGADTIADFSDVAHVRGSSTRRSRGEHPVGRA